MKARSLVLGGLLGVALSGCGGCDGSTTEPGGGGTSPTSTGITGSGGSGGTPAAFAPPLDRTIATTVAGDASFIYAGDAPIQKGVLPGTIDARRISVLSGTVRGEGGAALPGVAVTVLRHPEYGSTVSRADGRFDLVVNGGGRLTLSFAKTGSPPATRDVEPRWQGYVVLPDLALRDLDAQVTPVETSGQMGTQIARGSVVNEQGTTRQATLIFADGTHASMRLPDSSTQALDAMHVRATEFTVGASGPAAMPAALPPTSAYTYAVELSADEAIEADATTVELDKPAAFYVENFLGFPVGTDVPTGFYDRSAATWKPSANGKVIAIVAVNGGIADIDADGDGQADGAAALAALGISGAERAELGALYPAGTTLWRAPMTHFTPWDCNWGIVPPDGATGPIELPPRREIVDDPCQVPGNSTVDVQNQALGEDLPLAGTRFTLHYQSDLVAGRTAEDTLQIPLSVAGTPPGLQHIQLEVSVAGHTIAKTTFDPSPGQVTTMTWDRKDAFGRLMQGTQLATVRVGYSYLAHYQVVPAFGWPGAGQSLPAGNIVEPRTELTLWDTHEITVGTWDRLPEGLGGWSLDVHHVYEPSARVLHLGSGERRSEKALGNVVIKTVAGSYGGFFSGEGGPATKATLSSPWDVVVAPDGSLYASDRGTSHRVVRVDPKGILTTFAGTGLAGYGGDGGPASKAKLDTPTGLALGPDGSLYIADTQNNRIRRVGPDGVISTVVGTGAKGFGGDGELATQAQIDIAGAADVAVGPDGSLYLTDNDNYRVRRVGPDGIISTFAGDGQFAAPADGKAATKTSLMSPMGLTVGADGSVYIADQGAALVVRVGPDGILRIVAGTPSVWGYAGDGGPATAAQLAFPTGLAASADGHLYIADRDNFRIRAVSPEGIITTVAGGGSAGASDAGFGEPAASAFLQGVASVFAAPDRTVYLVDPVAARVHRLQPALPELSFGEIPIAGGGGSEVYVFDASGRHLRTVDTMTKAVRYQFSYDAGGRLASVTDVDELVTKIERDPLGNPTAIVAPFGQRTRLALDAHGYLSTLTTPANETIALTHDAGGLLTKLADPLGHARSYTYDAAGRLTKDQGPSGESLSLDRKHASQGYGIDVVTSLGQTTRYGVDDLSTGGQSRPLTGPDGLQTKSQVDTDGTRTTTAPDGTQRSFTPGPDPRFGMMSPLSRKSTVKTPGGLLLSLAETRTATLADPADPLSLVSLSSTTTVNGLTYTTSYDAASRTWTSTTPMGRQVMTTIDAAGRLVGVVEPGVTPVQIAYDTSGRPQKQTQGPRQVTFGYAPDGLLASVTGPLATKTSIARDADGRVTEQTLPGPRKVAFAYDAAGNIGALTPPGRPAHTFGYDASDRLVGYTPPPVSGAGPTAYAYDTDGRTTKFTRPDGRVLSFGYNGAGRLASLTFPGGDRTYARDATTGKLATISTQQGDSIAFGYDGPLLTDLTVAGAVAGSVHLGHDDFFRVVSESVNGGAAISRQYDDDGFLQAAGALSLQRDATSGRLTGSTLGGVSDTIDYDAFGAPAIYTAKVQGAAKLSIQLVYDDLGRVQQKTDTVLGQTHTYVYTYAPAGWLSGVTRDGAPYATYTFDANGNRTAYTGPLGDASATHDAQDRVLTYGGATFTHTANGEIDTRTNAGGTTTYGYDALGNLVSVDLPGGTQIAYVLDAQSRRIARKLNGSVIQRLLYAGGLGPIAELGAGNTVTSRFVYATHVNVPDYIVKGSSTYRVITDHLGSVRLVVDTATGALAQQMDYDEFGNVLADTSPGFQPFGFAGGLYDGQTGLVHFGAREYDPRLGRWTSKDPLLLRGRDANLYAYAGNNPVNRVDPRGLFPPGERAAWEMRKWLERQIADAVPTSFGFSLAFDLSLPFFGGGGGTVGLNLQWTRDNGWALYFFSPAPNTNSEGTAFGMSCQIDVGWGRGSWEGEFMTVETGYGPVSGLYFESPYDPGSPNDGWKGISLGVGIPTPVPTATFMDPTYVCILGCN